MEKTKTLILFYSLSGNTKGLAHKTAKELGADIEEVFEVKKSSAFNAYFLGIIRALKRAKPLIKPLKSQINNYEKLIIMSPVWACKPAPAINTLFSLLPAGKKVELIMVSGGGGTKISTNTTKAIIKKQGCEVVGYKDLRAKKENGNVIFEQLK